MTVGPRRTAVRGPARLAAVLTLAALALPLVGCTDDDDATPPPPTTTPTTTPTPPTTMPRSLQADARRVRRELAGIPQARLVLGSPEAPVTVVEYADPTCGPCIAAQRGLVRTLVERYVRPGVASLELRPLATGARAGGVARSAFAASLQQQGWDFWQ
ncbi:MAG TPA: thioredoxin domain-containing protein, partial [Gaiella sp.]|nr:thioredoxin domain-containing protein [Gaiella sp.]